MKLPLKLTLITLLMGSSLSAQVPDSEVYNRLFYACKAWGHVKYFHTEVAKGNVNWDNELLNALNGIKTAEDNASFNRALMSMLNAAGEMGTSSNTLPNVPDSLNNNMDDSWQQNSIFSEEVQTVLKTIQDRFRPQDNVYLGQGFVDGNPTFDTDDAFHSGPDYPDENKRILALFRYWNIINYFFPYKYIMDQDWDTTLAEFIPQIVEAEDALAYHLVFREFTAHVNDSHAFFSSPTWWNWNGGAYAPFEARFVENEMVITKVLPGVDEVKVGDVIKKIDGIDIDYARDSLRQYSYGSNDAVIEREINSLILWGAPGLFSVTVDSGTGLQTKNLLRSRSYLDELARDESPIWRTTISGNCNFGIADMGRLKPADVGEMFAEFRYTDAIVFDIRNYPWDGPIYEIIKYLYQEDLDIASFTVPDITYPGRLYWSDLTIGIGEESVYEGEVIILFDERTQSHAEFSAMGLEQFDRATKVGSTTAGADGNISTIYLPGQIRAVATFLGTYYPDYTPTQRIGIVPDYEVHPTIAGIRSGEDEVLNFALNCDLLEDGDIIAGVETFETLKFYPNPATREVNYDLSNYGKVFIELYDLNGRPLLSTHSPAGTLDVSGLNEGMYLIKAQLNDRSVTTKLMVRH